MFNFFYLIDFNKKYIKNMLSILYIQKWDIRHGKFKR